MQINAVINSQISTEGSMTNMVKGFSEGLASAVRGVDKTVVRVEGRRRLPASGVVWPEDGIVVTANHVLERDDAIRVGTSAGDRFDAKMVGRDPSTDLAVLRIEGELTSIEAWSPLEDLQVGHLVLALGRPSKEVQATLGIISALEDDRKTPLGGSLSPYIQTDVVMYPGFSGGPLIDVDGSILGVNTSVFRGASVTISAPTVKLVAESLLAHGRILRGYLGVGLQPVKLPGELSQSLDQDSGLLITGVEPKGPAAESGITLGDTILSFNSEKIERIEELHRSLAGDLIGKPIAIGLLRGGEMIEREVVVGERA
jgi:S1-C subfamily serine protease